MLRLLRVSLPLVLVLTLITVVLANQVYLKASLSASEARPGDVLTASVGIQGCDLPLRLSPQQGIIGYTRAMTSTEMQNISVPVRITWDAWPGVRSIQINCGETEERLSLNVVDAGWIVHVPIVRR